MTMLAARRSPIPCVSSRLELRQTRRPARDCSATASTSSGSGPSRHPASATRSPRASRRPLAASAPAASTAASRRRPSPASRHHWSPPSGRGGRPPGSQGPPPQHGPQVNFKADVSVEPVPDSPGLTQGSVPVDLHRFKRWSQHANDGAGGRAKANGRDRQESGTMDCRALNKLLASGHQELVISTVETHFDSFDAINTATALRSLAGHSRDGSFEQTGKPLQRRAQRALEQLCLQVVKGAPGYLPRTLASCAHSLARLRCRFPPVWAAIARVATLKAGELNGQDIANLLWACAAVGYNCRPLFQAVGRQAADKAHRLKAGELSISVWALAKMDYLEPALIQATTEVALSGRRNIPAQSVANLLWAISRSGLEAPELLDSLALHVEQTAHTMGGQNLSNCASGLYKAGCCSSTAYDAIAHEVARRPEDLNPKELSITVWAFARAGKYDPAFLHAVQTRAMQLADRLPPQATAMILWSFATLRYDAPHLFQRLTVEVLSPKWKGALSSRDLANILWAHASLTYNPPDQMYCNPLLFSDLNAQELCNTVWALTVIGLMDTVTLGALGPRLEAVDPGDFTDQGLTQLTQADQAVLGLNPQSPSCLPSHLSRRSKAVWERALAATAQQEPSFLQETVLNTLSDMGVSASLHELHGMLCMCIVVEMDSPGGGPGPKLAVEVEGPSHFTRTEPPRPMGGTVLRRRMLRLAGWNVVSVPFYEWTRLARDGQRQAYLSQLLNIG